MNDISKPPVTYLIFLICVLLLTACASQNPSSPVLNYEKADKDYLALKQTIVNRVADSTTFDRIWLTYSLSSFYNPTDDLEPSTKLLTETYISEGNYAACIEAAQRLLEVNYTSLTGHFAMAECSRLMGDARQSDFHTWVLDNLIEAIWRTGDGRAPGTAFLINSTHDLYAFIQLHQLVAVGQDLVYEQGMPVQKILVQTPENMRSSTWYFNATPQFRRSFLDKAELKN
ncbi:DUF4919 domain-containing protein [Glaciecola siphonariae]|uniref:DUF4919 domain-containing protein n=1 Tax=Glaciecola siphonariae TaxID=521012 RepID=A0ABV9LR32_9ALTE